MKDKKFNHETHPTHESLKQRIYSEALDCRISRDLIIHTLLLPQEGRVRRSGRDLQQQLLFSGVWCVSWFPSCERSPHWIYLTIVIIVEIIKKSRLYWRFVQFCSHRDRFSGWVRAGWVHDRFLLGPECGFFCVGSAL